MSEFIELLPFLDSILIYRLWEESNLPLGQSALAYDLMTFVARSTIAGEIVTTNKLLQSLPYSETGVRKQLGRFTSAGWIKVEPCKIDKRIRYVVAEKKLLSAFKAYASIRPAPHKHSVSFAMPVVHSPSSQDLCHRASD